MTEKAEQKPRVARMGATISLPAYSSMRIDVVEPVEGEGLDINKTALYLKTIAKNLGGTLALPTLDGEKAEAKETDKKETRGKLQTDFFGRPMEYDEEKHRYSVDGVNYVSATTLVDQFYPMEGTGKFIAPEYLENAAMYGSFIHKIFENAVKGFLSRKPSLNKLQTQVADFMKDIDVTDGLFTEQMIYDEDLFIAGRFDVLAGHTLIDWKTNNELFGKKKCLLPKEVKDELSDITDWDSIWGSYVIQQNLYAYMLNKIKPETVTASKIVWAKDIDEDIKVFDVPLMTEDQILSIVSHCNKPN